MMTKHLKSSENKIIQDYKLKKQKDKNNKIKKNYLTKVLLILIQLMLQKKKLKFNEIFNYINIYILNKIMN